MNEYQESLDVLKQRNMNKTEFNLIGNEFADRLYIASVETLQELVDKATPIKPNRVICRTQISEYSTMIEHKVYCPICNTKILIEGNCCPNNDCRQAIDWSQDE